MRERRRTWIASADEVFAGSVTAVLLVLLAVMTVWGRRLLPELPLENTTQVLLAVLVIAVIGLTTLLAAERSH